MIDEETRSNHENGRGDAMPLYDLAKDFQPLVAASVALGAAITAYRSTQAAARKQSETALTVQKQQFEQTEAREERARRQRELAMLIRLRMKFEIMGLLLADRMIWIRQIENQFTKASGGSGYIVSDHPVWVYF